MQQNLFQAKILINKCLKSKNTYLDLGNCGIINLDDLPELFDCIHVEHLVFSDSWMKNYNFFRTENKGIRNKLAGISIKFKKLQNLKVLIINDCGANQWDISSFSSLSKLSKLQYLYLQKNNLSDISFLSDFKQLRVLDLGHNQISDISILSNLVQLQDLNIADNQVSDISFLSSLDQMHHLNSNSNQIYDASNLSNLSQLNSLFLGYNQIEDISFLSALNQLQTLDLSDNQISNFDVFFSNNHLQYLALRSNHISDIDFLSGNGQLHSLDLSDNNISDISIISKLEQLQTLVLSSNIISDISCLSKLNHLENLALRKNLISDIPQFIFKLDDWRTTVELIKNNNPISNPPLEIIAQGQKAILNWFAVVKKELNEVKIILIGDPKAGKTSLLKKLKNDTFDLNETQTDGVNIEDINFGENENFKLQKNIHNLIGHFWDFGGQEIMNATHQFFLTKRSIYILVLDARTDNDVSNQIKKWVKRIKSSGRHSPIIILANKIDVNPGFGFENETDLKNEFPEIKYMLTASCSESTNIDIFKNRLAEVIPLAELFHTEIDERWISIKETLQIETKQDSFLNERRFKEICIAAELDNEEEQKQAIQFLHDLGLVLHFEDIAKELAEYYVLDPYWITYGVYQILTSKRAADQKGRVNISDLDYIINKEEEKKQSYKTKYYKKINYSTNERKFLVDILNRFKLCFYHKDKEEFIIPDLLDTKEPTDKTSDLRKSVVQVVQFVYEYAYLPRTIMPQIIVETNMLIIDMWRTGCLLGKNDCQALISSYDNRIFIYVIGGQREKNELLIIIRSLLDVINKKSSYQHKKLIPLPALDNEYADYQVLLNREKKGKENYYFHEDLETEQKFLIKSLLEGIPAEEEISKVDLILQNQNQLLGNQQQIKVFLNKQYDHLVSLPQNKVIKNMIIPAVKEISNDLKMKISKEFYVLITELYKIQESHLDDELKDLYSNLKKSNDLNLKISTSIPLLNTLGINIKYDLISWSKKMYNKYELEIFKLFGYL